MNKTRLYVFDLDGTLADVTHRLPLIRIPNNKWDEFFKACVRDKPIWWMTNLFSMIDEYEKTLILTGRSDEVKEETLTWLWEEALIHPDHLKMRPKGNHLPDTVLKPRLLEAFLAEHPNYEVQFIVEDRSRMANVWRAKGYNVLQCAKGDF